MTPSKRSIKIIGITGGIGAGKSTVLEYLCREYKAKVIQADEVGHQVMEPATEVYGAVLELFGSHILSADKKIDRKKLSAIVFENPSLLEQLNGIVHPAVREHIKETIAGWEEEGAALGLVESALPLEAGLDTLCDEVWYIYADREVRIQRLMEYRHETRQKVENVMRRQLSEEEFRAHSDFTVDNSRGFDKTKRQMEQRLKEKLLSEERADRR